MFAALATLASSSFASHAIIIFANTWTWNG
jgi:hypothetical protein